MTPQEILLKAANLIEMRGWFDGKCDSPGKVCASTAISSVVGPGSGGKASAARTLLLEYFASQGTVVGHGDTYTRIYKWNDAQPDAEAVVNAMRAAARA